MGGQGWETRENWWFPRQQWSGIRRLILAPPSLGLRGALKLDSVPSSPVSGVPVYEGQSPPLTCREATGQEQLARLVGPGLQEGSRFLEGQELWVGGEGDWSGRRGLEVGGAPPGTESPDCWVGGIRSSHSPELLPGGRSTDGLAWLERAVCQGGPHTASRGTWDSRFPGPAALPSTPPPGTGCEGSGRGGWRAGRGPVLTASALQGRQIAPRRSPAPSLPPSPGAPSQGASPRPRPSLDPGTATHPLLAGIGLRGGSARGSPPGRILPWTRRSSAQLQCWTQVFRSALCIWVRRARPRPSRWEGPGHLVPAGREVPRPLPRPPGGDGEPVCQAAPGAEGKLPPALRVPA